MTPDNNSRRSCLTAAIVLLLLTASAIYVALSVGRDEELENDLKDEKLNAESLLSEKLLLEKEVDNLKADLTALEEQNSNSEKSFQENTTKHNVVLPDLSARTEKQSAVRQLKDHQTKLLSLNDSLLRLVAVNETSLATSQRMNRDLQTALNVSQSWNNELEHLLKSSERRSMNDVLIETTRKNGKLDVKAKKVKTLTASIDIASLTEPVTFRIITPSGRELTQKEGRLEIKNISKNNSTSNAFYTAPATSQLIYNRIQLRYAPNEKLAPGIYKIEISSKAEPIGTLQVKLR